MPVEQNRGSSNPRVLAISRRIEQVARENFESSRVLRKLTRDVSNLRLTVDPSVHPNTILLTSTEVNNNVICVICRLMMSIPSTIAECGHTFCQNCLMEWFDHIKLEHEAGQPNQQDANQEYIQFFHDVSRNLDISTDCIPTFRKLLRSYFPDPPLYSCPACRTHVLSPPIVVFALKELIHSVALASFDSDNDSSPQSQHRQTQSQGDSVWDKFFARRPASVTVR